MGFIPSVQGAGSPSDAGGFFDNLMKGLGDATEGKRDQLTIIADLLGQRIAPNNAFGGIGTAMTKSKIAGEKLESDQQGSAGLLQKIIENLSSGSDMNQASFKKDPKTGEITVNETSVMPKELDKIPQKQKEKSASTSDFQKSSDVSTQPIPGSMRDLYNTYLGDSNGE